MTSDELCNWIRDKVALMAGIGADAIDMERDLASYGLDSAAAVELLVQLEDVLGRQLDPALVWDRPTIRALANELAKG